MELPRAGEIPSTVSKTCRPGATGRRKTKSGCQTCKIRHKKCNEARPSCGQCSSTGRRCDFLVMSCKPDLTRGARSQLSLNTRPSYFPTHIAGLTSFETKYFEYFEVVSTKEFALYFDSALWEDLVLRYALVEPSICCAALAISALSRHEYYPTPFWYDPGHTGSAAEYSLAKYNSALRRLNSRLDSSVESVELATFASVLFVYIEGMQGRERIMQVHLRGGLALVHSLKLCAPNAGLFESALWQICEQMKQIRAINDNK